MRRASGVVNLQWMVALWRLRRCCQAVGARPSVAAVGSRRGTHGLPRLDRAISARCSQEACGGVSWNRRRLHQPCRLVRAACVQQGCLEGRVEMVADARETWRRAVARQTDHTFHLTGHVGVRAAVGHGHRTPAPLLGHGKADIPDPMPCVCVVLSSRCARVRGRPTARVVQERWRCGRTAAPRFCRIIEQPC